MQTQTETTRGAPELKAHLQLHEMEGAAVTEIASLRAALDTPLAG